MHDEELARVVIGRHTGWITWDTTHTVRSQLKNIMAAARTAAEAVREHRPCEYDQEPINTKVSKFDRVRARRRYRPTPQVNQHRASDLYEKTLQTKWVCF